MGIINYIARSAYGQRLQEQWERLVQLPRDHVEELYPGMRAEAIMPGRYDVDLQFMPPCLYVFCDAGGMWRKESGQRGRSRVATVTAFIGIPPMASSDARSWRDTIQPRCCSHCMRAPTWSTMPATLLSRSTRSSQRSQPWR